MMDNTQITNYDNSAVAIFGDKNMLAGADFLAKSSIIPETFRGNAANVLIALDMAQRNHLPAMMVMQNLNIIKGKPSWSSKFLIAMINASGRFASQMQYDFQRDKDGKPVACTAYVISKNGEKISGPVVTAEMVKGEGWDSDSKNRQTGETILSKWKTMPELMYSYRAAAFFANTVCPDLAMGLYTEYEQMDINNSTQSEQEYEDKTVQPEPEPEPVKVKSPRVKLSERALSECGGNREAATKLCVESLNRVGISSAELTEENLPKAIQAMIGILAEAATMPKPETETEAETDDAPF